MYRIKELFYTVQGEGTHTGRPAVFCRFAGCNLWSGREHDRAGAVCQINCDTDFVGSDAGDFTDPDRLARKAADLLPTNAWESRTPMIVLTGGEPLLQVDQRLLMSLLAIPFYVAVETNGTKPVPLSVDWVCVSPKAGTELAVTEAQEVKLVYPQPGLSPEQAERLVTAPSYRLQPMDGPELKANTRAAVEYVLAHPHWSLSLQTHKFIGMP